MMIQSINNTAISVNSTSPISEDRIPITIAMSAYPSTTKSYPYHCKMLKEKKTISRRRQQQYIKPNITFSYNNLLTLLFTISIIMLTHQIVLVSAQQQQQQQQEIISNPLNQYCGPTYTEAKKYCHLTNNPSKSLPCPNGKYYEFYTKGGNDKCPYDMTCWTIKETCVVDPNTNANNDGESNINLQQQPAIAVDEESNSSTSTTADISSSEEEQRSPDETDHYFCGLGYTNLFQCATPCPNGSPVDECPIGQLCFFDTPCDARKEGMLLKEQQYIQQQQQQQANEEEEVSHDPADYINARPPPTTVGASNFCGKNLADASANCTQARHCPNGSNNECLTNDVVNDETLYCFTHVTNCNIYEMPTAEPTISSQPTNYPTIIPTTRNPSWTNSPSMSPLDADDIRNFFFCGTSWGDASNRW